MKLARFFTLFTVLILVFSVGACSSKKTTKLAVSDNADQPRDGRDRELFEDALKEMQKKRYEQGRLLINTMVTTYGDSPLLPMAKLTIADSYYREGGTPNLVQAEAEYRDWLQFFPNHELAPDVLIKTAEIHLRQVQTPDREQEHALKAEKILLETTRRFPQTKDNAKIKEYIDLVQEKLATHDLGVARFYFERRDAWKATESRCLDVVNKYPSYTDLDIALWYLGRSLEEQENTEDASKYFARIVREFPSSKYRDAAAEKLERFGKAIPDPDPDVQEKVAERRSMMMRVMENLFGPTVAVSKEGILLKEGDKIDESTYELISNASRNTGTSPNSQGSSIGTKPAITNTSNSEASSSGSDNNGDANQPKIKEKKKSKKSKE
ncbi:MAG: putative lipoprotein [bacterium]|nr:MAG: putative lipoprotein [bacterium]